MIKDCDSPYDGRHEGAARLGQDRHFTGSVSQYHGGCGPLSSFRTPSGRVFAKIKGPNAAYRTDPPDSGTARSPDPDGQRYGLRSRRPAAVAAPVAPRPAPGAPRPRAWRPTARGAIPPVGQPRGPRGDSLVCLGRLRRLWRLRSCRAVPDGRRGRVGSAGAMIVFLLGPVFTAVGVSVFRRGRYATRRAHYDHFVRPRCCAW